MVITNIGYRNDGMVWITQAQALIGVCQLENSKL